MKHRLFSLFLIILFLLSGITVSASVIDKSNKIDSKTLQKLHQGKSHVEVIVLLTGYKNYVGRIRSDKRSDMAKSHASILSNQDNVLKQLPQSHFTLKHRLENIPGFSARVTREGIQKLASLPDVEVIESDEMVEAHLAQGIPLMQASAPRSLYNGTGVSLAIVDTGINYNHSMLGGGGFPNDKVIGGYDFGDSDADPLDCHGHGTSVAGISAGTLAAGPGDYIGGVAHNAKLYALKIVSGCEGSAWDSDIIAAWDWAVTHKNDDPNNPILIINTSFGGGKYLSACDDSHQSLAAAANNAVANGITLFGSSGNNAYINGISSPSCVSNSISVGAVYDANVGYHGYGICTDSTTAADKVTCYSNSADFLDILAPSHDAYTTAVGGGYTSSFGGTSAASPYAAGVGALLQSYAKSNYAIYYSPLTLKAKLLHGDPITDPRNGITKPRVNAGSVLEDIFSVFRTAASPLIDGDLSEFTDADSIALSPSSGGNTVTIKALWDNEALYLAYEVTDTQLSASVTTRDGEVWNEDSVEWAIDTLNNDGGSENPDSEYMLPDDYHGIVNILNTQYDSQGTVSGSPSNAWNGNWQSIVVQAAGTGYTVEVKIPWITIGYSAAPAGDTLLRVGFLLNDRDGLSYDNAMWPEGGGAAFENASNWGEVVISTTALTLWYQDNDGDGYGNPSIFLQQRTQPAGYVLDNTDCDDRPDGVDDISGTSDDGENINPGATEVCDEIDNNCDGEADSYSMWGVCSGDIYVEPNDVCGGRTPCYPTIQEGLTAADSGATIKVAQGTYHENLYKGVPLFPWRPPVLIWGGWNSNYLNRVTDPYMTVIDGDNGDVISIVGISSKYTKIDIESLSLVNGNKGISVSFYSDVNLINIIISGNVVGIDAYCGPYGDFHGGCSVTLTNSIIYGNGTGVGLYSSGNSLGYNGSVSFSSMNSSIINNNIGISAYDGDNSDVEASLLNTIVYGNNTIDVDNSLDDCIWWYTETYCSALYVSYSDIGYINDSGGTYNDDGTNFNVDPLFKDISYHLSPSSPLINKGNSSAPSLPSTDFEGDQRTINCLVDIGADEVQPATGLWHETSDNSTPDGRIFTSTCTESWWYGQDSTGNYDTGSANTGSLTTPPYTISTGHVFSFWSWEETEAFSGYDTRKVNISSDMGATWQEIRNLFGTENQWYKVEVPLVSYIGQTVMFKFTFNTVDDLYNNYTGWYLDEIQVEECSTVYYRDFDGDGYGDPNTAMISCTLPPTGYISDNTDCDDTNPAINPSMLWYPDDDGDGYGNPAVSIQQCTQPAGPPVYVLDNTDYDDNDANIYPGGPAVRIAGTSPAYYLTIQEAYNTAGDGDTIECQETTFTENLSINIDKFIILKGGYNGAFTVNTGNTTLNGNITIRNGSLAIESFIVQ